ncbi:hypothetical protein [Sinosporangium siamense]|uniref:Uncharacterized protein n=1 Tax=Sinosporangium siamense TaxID=1367973 RepID=A0A919RCJ6_9ACTN|nr:hypothetical protein [Sinosporangium siamense]GII91163.1 hypothetical protein Ssi02_13940 [Sinosporangium siamense]
MIATAIGRTLTFEEIPASVVREQMSNFVPLAIVDAVLNRLAESVGGPAEVSGAVRELTGRAPLTFDEWVADHLPDFR